LLRQAPRKNQRISQLPYSSTRSRIDAGIAAFPEKKEFQVCSQYWMIRLTLAHATTSVTRNIYVPGDEAQVLYQELRFQSALISPNIGTQ